MSLTRYIPESIKRGIKKLVYKGNDRFCPVCKGKFSQFLATGMFQRANAQCPGCNALERHRLFWRYLQERTAFFQSHGTKMLHIAAEKCFEPLFRKNIGPGYLTADLLNPADVKMDITDIQYPDNTFDIVYCSHVLEHVPDDRKAMREFFRVLKPTGFAILLVPITAERTVEDPSITDPAERLRLFGQHDHVRCYGPDYVERLREAGFNVTETRAQDFLSPSEIERLAIGTKAAGEIYHCTKPN